MTLSRPEALILPFSKEPDDKYQRDQKQQPAGAKTEAFVGGDAGIG
jgi:hypothetical protein